VAGNEPRTTLPVRRPTMPRDQWADWIAAGERTLAARELEPPDQRDRRRAYKTREGDPGGMTQPADAARSASSLSPARNVAFFATVTDEALDHFCALPPSWKAAFTADPKYPVTDEQIARVRKSGHQAFAWGDCHSPGLMPNDIQAFRVRRGLAGWYGEAESAGAFDWAMRGAIEAYVNSFPVALVGKIDTLRDDQLALVAAGQVLFINETYFNVQPDLVPNWRNANEGIGGNCWACYASDKEGAVYTPVDSRFNPETDSVYTEGMLAGDWREIA
jgi:hypothetical protein